MELKTELKEFLSQKGFNLIENKFEGRVLIYSSGYLIIRFVQDFNSFKAMDISKQNSDKWFGITIIRSFILNNEDYLKPLDFEAACQFFIQYFDTIVSYFNETNYPSSVISFKALEKRRGDILFGKK